MHEFRSLVSGLFATASLADWREVARRGKSAGLKRLTSTTMDGLPVGPLYAPGDGPVLPMRASGTPWSIVQRIDDGDGTRLRDEIAAAMEGGATGIELVFRSGLATHGRAGLDPERDLGDLLSGPGHALRIDAGELAPRLAGRFASANGIVVAAFDPLAAMALRGGLSRPLAKCIDEIGDLVRSQDRDGRPGVAFVADGRPWHDGGASEVQELAAALASGVTTLRLLESAGTARDRAWGRMGVTLSADADQFLTLAKFRAARLLFARLAELLGVDRGPPPVHAETSWRMLSRREPTMNMIRATTAVFAAAAGGADSITVLPPLFGDEAFDARMARNTQSILLGESWLDRADAPGAGAGGPASGWRIPTWLRAGGD